MSTNTESSHSTRKKSKFGLHYLDMLGSKFSLSFSTPTGRFQTNMGGALTILLGLVSVVTFLVVMSQYFDKTAPVVTNSTEFSSKVNKFNLYEQEMYPIFGMFFIDQYLTQGHERFASIVAHVEKVFFDVNEQKFKMSWQKQFDYVPCRQINDTKMLNYIRKINSDPGFVNMLLCPDFRGEEHELEAIDDYETQNYRWVRISVYPCSLPDKTKCASAQELKFIRLDYGHLNKLLIPSDFNNPIQDFLVMRYIQMDPSLRKVIKIDMKHTKVIDDASRFAEPVIKKEFSKNILNSVDYSTRTIAQLHCPKALIDTGHFAGCLDYISFGYAAIGEVEIIRRNYRKWTAILGEFGGIMKVMTSAVFFFYTFYNLRRVKNYLGSLIFSGDEQKKQFLEIEKRARKQKDRKVMAPRKKEEVSYDEVMKKLTSSVSKIDNLVQRLNTLEILEKVILSEDQRDLIPLVLYQAKKKELLLSKEKVLSQTKPKQSAKKGDNSGIFGSRKIQILPKDSHNPGSSTTNSLGDKSLIGSYRRLLQEVTNSDQLDEKPTQYSPGQEISQNKESDQGLTRNRKTIPNMMNLHHKISDYIVSQLKDLFEDEATATTFKPHSSTNLHQKAHTQAKRWSDFSKTPIANTAPQPSLTPTKPEMLGNESKKINIQPQPASSRKRLVFSPANSLRFKKRAVSLKKQRLSPESLSRNHQEFAVIDVQRIPKRDMESHTFGR